MDSQNTEELTPEQKAQLAKQKKKENELKKKQAAEEWKRQQMLKKEQEANQQNSNDTTANQKEAQKNAEVSTSKDTPKTNQQASKQEAAAPQKSQKEDANNKQKQNQQANQSRNQRIQQSLSKTNNLISHLSTYDQISFKQIREKYQNHPYANSLLHPALLEVALKVNSGQIVGSNRRCLSFLDALKKIITDFKVKEGDVFYKELTNCIDSLYSFLETFRAHPEGLKTAFKYVKNIVSYLVKSTISIEPQKKWINQQIDVFIKQKILNAQELMIQTGLELIKNGDVILVYARSQVVENLLLTAFKKGKQFTVIVVDNPPFHEGKLLLQKLSEAGIETIYTLLSNIPYFIKKASKIFVGAQSMLTNGALISRVGTALLACVSRDFRTPFHVFCESYKFSEKSQLDSLSQNELCLQKNQEGTEQQQAHQYLNINLRYDLTPCEYVNMVITEIGPVPPTSVHAIIREFTSYDYVGKIELPSE
ncbi:translation initiation factor 2B subunit, eIF-2B alpha/beta/delta family protein (macronuclear) [Tetrahymena thermophila SB210]|uniref:Translation initiation factor eIF2B subunit delta n=1 Tax=Tetrahymena thermophila (strain SB210) TaxID=312017 RepID=I7MLB3_TETTS|nr:translation initiation factor 2B subunit, eIF-2B alpha/beta/delta family protein [Tetrahymena thermophila SB210]EAS01605.1 translation initiation factor 2B subunit, eIF-2B alpha/beta/delta family protein [Tetrahymena thermophila SB210]|eukprot:XP_001021850.1 translation initiation factor 2B subunit, eIF-2B alpha/beta/delta family protein [Tetrahymena thermophila SB210]